jgi:N-ethylmaleimide reductase
VNTLPEAPQATLLTPYRLGQLDLRNRVVMSPMTRARSVGGVPVVALESRYYTQRASAGLVITGGIYVSKQAVGGINVPGIYTEEQVEAWRQITQAVHAAGGTIFAQLSHSGAVSHPTLLDGELPVAPSPINPRQKVMTSSGYVDTVDLRELKVEEIKAIVEDYALAARNAQRAGFDGVEIHGANVYLIPQFLSSSTNTRQDLYGGTPANRARFVLEILTTIARVWDHDRIGLKLSPAITGVAAHAATDYVLSWLSDFTPAYLHLRRGFDSNGTPIEMLREHTFDHFRAAFDGTLIGNGGFDPMTANAHIERGNVDLVSFARHYVSNPDLVPRIAAGYSLAPSDPKMYYTGGPSGYTDYPSMPTTG